MPDTSASSRDPDLLNPRAVLNAHGLRPNKRLGQHFLTSTSHLARIVDAADLRPTDTVLEIGPGLGVLTDALACRVARVIAVEIDPAMREVLSSTVRNHTNVDIVAADVLRTETASLLASPGDASGMQAGFKVVANLPYQITSAVLRHVLESRVQPELAVVMVQAEVAERITAEPYNMSILAVAVQFYAKPSWVTRVPAECFHPPPKVDSAVVRLDTYAEPPVDVVDVDAFFRVVRAGFSQKRKQLRNSLSAGLSLDKPAVSDALASASIDPTRRAETLSLEDWARLARRLPT